MTKQRITLYIDSDIYQMFRVLCTLDKLSASAYVQGLMEHALGDTNIPEQFRFGKIDSQIDSSDKREAPDANAPKAS